MPVAVKAVGAAVERQRRIVEPHFRFERRNVAGAHIGGIGDDDVEGSGQRLAPATLNNLRALPESAARQILPRGATGGE